jgi:DNA-binding response OmpR family regulator
VVILDIGMPKLTGYEVARIFDRHPRGTRPVLIAVTAWGREADRLRAQLSGFDHHFTKPVDPAAVLARLRALPERGTSRRRRILIVDDHRAWTDSLADLLLFEGHDVRKAYDGAEAVAIAAGFSPQVVLLDLRMPRMSGHDAARAFRRQPAGTRPLLIAVSAFDAEVEREAALKSGFDHFLPKPVQLDRLNPLLEAVAE